MEDVNKDDLEYLYDPAILQDLYADSPRSQDLLYLARSRQPRKRAPRRVSLVEAPAQG